MMATETNKRVPLRLRFFIVVDDSQRVSTLQWLALVADGSRHSSRIVARDCAGSGAKMEEIQVQIRGDQNPRIHAAFTFRACKKVELHLTIQLLKYRVIPSSPGFFDGVAADGPVSRCLSGSSKVDGPTGPSPIKSVLFVIRSLGGRCSLLRPPSYVRT